MAFDPRNRKIGDYVDAAVAAAGTRGVAAGTGDNTEVVGPTINRASYGYAKSALLVICGSAILASGETLTLKNMAIEHDDDAAFGSGADLQTAADEVVLTGLSGGAAQDFAKVIEVDLAGAQQYMRTTFTPDLSRAGTDIFTLSAAFILGGQDVLPT
jgi:hypothetical protein